MSHQPLVEDAFLRARWQEEYESFKTSPEAKALLERLRSWAGREVLKETASEAAFIQRFFVETWGYALQGAAGDARAYTCRPQFAVGGAGQTGGKGAADLALGAFGVGADGIPQVLCEFKDIRSGLDSPQPRKGNNRSPVVQCFDYLTEAYNSRQRDALVAPAWALVTDMNEFRLYARGNRGQYQRFVISGPDDPRHPNLLGETESAAFVRFLFWRTFRPDLLLSARGESQLTRLLRDEIVHEKNIEGSFYREYRAYREYVYKAIVEANPAFKGTRGKLVRLTQRLLDRCIFILFCEDMGRTLRYPPELLRDLLIECSNSRFYDPEGTAPWDAARGLFRAMRDGGTFGTHRIDRFNGGLFAEDAELESLHVPAKVFCAKGQGAGGETTLKAHPCTLLYFSAAYNFGLNSGAGAKAIGLYTLGRIFEQSITELEIMEADADGRVSLNRLSKRKCDGVYYTPEWVTRYIVENTVGTRLADIKTELGFNDLPPLTEAALSEYRAYKKDSRRTARVASEHMAFLKDYRLRLNLLTVVDPACGSGAFLIQALEYLVAEYRWILAEQERITGIKDLFDQDGVILSILSNNLYGVDINQESVEITKLALWLHTASPGKPLCALDRNIQCGNSLVGLDFEDFYRQKHETLFSAADENERERINAFDWKAAFPTVFGYGGFDCVIGNPPYVKLQNFRRVQSDVADYLSEAKRPDGRPLYDSTQSGNFDLYLPFIEKGLDLLKPEGRLGYIAPNVWLVNEYGQGLRAKIKRGQHLDRWLDFKSYQVFEEAITYTALQFYQAKPVAGVGCAFAPGGEIADVDWSDSSDTVPYASLPDEGAWALLPAAEMRLVAKLQKQCNSLKESCSGIVVGIQTSADDIYHLQRLCAGRYRTRAGEEVAIEDQLMRPLVSGPEAKRYQVPITDTYLLFPYSLADAKPRLFTEQEMSDRFPRGLAYLKANERALRARENGAFNDTAWYRFGRNQNIDKQETPKLMVPRLITRLFCAMDLRGECFLDNVDVGGIVTKTTQELPFIAGIINSPVCNFVWRRTSKPFQNDFRSANKQFIAPLPIPDASASERREVGNRAKRLHELHTQRRDLAATLAERLQSPQTVAVTPQPSPDWLWAEVGTSASWRSSPAVPTGLKGRELTAWAKEQYEKALVARRDTLDNLLVPGARLEVTNDADTLTLSIAGREALRLFDKPDTPFIAAQWRHALRDVNVTEAFNGQRLLRLLLDLRTTVDKGLRDRIVALDAEIMALAAEITAAESEMNGLVYRLYKLSAEEIALVESVPG